MNHMKDIEIVHDIDIDGCLIGSYNSRGPSESNYGRDNLDGKIIDLQVALSVVY